MTQQLFALQTIQVGLLLTVCIHLNISKYRHQHFVQNRRTGCARFNDTISSPVQTKRNIKHCNNFYTWLCIVSWKLHQHPSLYIKHPALWTHICIHPSILC